MAKVVDKFVMQLEAQLADRKRHDRNSQTGRATGWSSKATTRRWAHARWRASSDDHQDARADEVLFGRLKDGGAVRVAVGEENGRQALTFEFPAGPVTPRPEKDVEEARKQREKALGLRQEGGRGSQARVSRKGRRRAGTWRRRRQVGRLRQVVRAHRAEGSRS